MKGPRVGLAAIVLALLGACAPGTDGIVITSAAVEEEPTAVPEAGPPILVELPTIPVVRLPALSAAGEYDALLEEQLGELSLTPLEGVEVVNVECQNGEPIYSLDEESEVFEDVRGFGDEIDFTFAPDGSGEYQRRTLIRSTTIRTFADGSGEFIEESPTRDLTIKIEADGSGEYYNDAIASTTTVDANADGSGTFYREGFDDLLTVKLFSDGSGELYSETSDQLVTIEARSDGSGEMYYQVDERIVTVLVRPDGSWEVQDNDFDHSVSVKVRADGTGQYRERGTGPALTLEFDAMGRSQGPDVVLPPAPQFLVAARFPQLGRLATVSPPCATVVRFDSAVFFQVNEADLLPEAKSLLAEIAPSLIEADRSIEINGHTDATGTDEYNLDLSRRRAQSVADELVSLGVNVELTVQGFGESQPIAPNYKPDGSDDVAGQRENRRVELVVNG